jgi:L-ascorbate metabolism protein UlaG (beta-lactamase superfamily)
MTRTAHYIWLLLVVVLGSECQTPSLEPYEAYSFPAVGGEVEMGSQLTVTFLGASTILFDDGETAFMTDAFFSRPSLRELRRLEPNQSVVAASLRQAGISTLAAVIPVHSHYDHVLDAPLVAHLTGALFIGSESSANVARGHELPEHQIMVVDDGDTLDFGRFRVTFIGSAHHEKDLLPGVIAIPLTANAPVNHYRTGDCFSLLIEHESRTMLVHASAGFVPGALEGHVADIVFLGIGRLGVSKEDYRLAYWKEVVQAVNARRVIPIHWDNLFKQLDSPLVPLPRFIDDFDASMAFLLGRASEANVDIRLPVAWQPVDPFFGLEDHPAVDSSESVLAGDSTSPQ